ncbi:MAG: hypothetical protein FWG55_02865 [Candidatus Bathyarchaeota archaeon]|nr:hypothetical protein [Candidatus Termiticorpusculum sp.]
MAEPYPIPVLSKEAAEEFERRIKKGPTKLQKEMMQQGIDVYNRTERKQ